MNKRSLSWYCFVTAGIIVICGCIRLLVDWLQYSSTLNSAPFSVWVLAVGATYGGAAVLCALIGWLLWRKENRKDDSL